VSVSFQPRERDRRADELLGEFPSQLFDDPFYAACELVDRYSLEWALEIAQGLDFPRASLPEFRMEDLQQAFRLGSEWAPALSWLLDRLSMGGSLERQPGSAVTYRLCGPLRAPQREPLQAMARDLGCGLLRTLALFDAAGQVWASVLRGECRAEDWLFSPQRIGLWVDYFHNENRTYAINNHLTALAAVHRLPRGKPWRVLEVGAGAGSATLSFLETIERLGQLESIESFWVTEPATFFRRRAERELRQRFPSLPFEFRPLDIDHAFSPQGLLGTFDLVFGVNVFHVAKNVSSSLRHVRQALKPGGWLVAGECIRLFPGQPVPAELVFQLLCSFREVELDPILRPAPGFLLPESWIRLFEAVGFEEVAVLPNLRKMREIYPRFFSGVIVGREPNGA
jgi:SAM-dependent methyltransferase